MQASNCLLRKIYLTCFRIIFVVQDLTLDPATRSQSSGVVHAIAVVGSRSQAKAAEFVAQHAPHGGWAQISKLTSLKPTPDAVGSYKEVWEHSVSNTQRKYINRSYLRHCVLEYRTLISSMLELFILLILRMPWQH